VLAGSPAWQTAGKESGTGDRLLASMSQALEVYRRQLSYSAGLVALSRGEDTSIRWLINKPIQTLENLLRKSDDNPWTGPLLGYRFSFIKQAMGTRGFPPQQEQRILHFRNVIVGRGFRADFSYSFRELGDMIARAEEWERGWVLGRTLEMLEFNVSDLYPIVGTEQPP